MMKGYIQRMVLKDGREQSYVFITGEDNKQYFLHQSDFRHDWSELSGLIGANSKVYVQFDFQESPKGGRASNCVFDEN